MPRKPKVTAMTVEKQKAAENKVVAQVVYTPNNEIIETKEGEPDIRVSQKFKDWTVLFFDKSKPETYGNATRSALAVYGTENYWSAATIGKENSKKLQNISVAVADNEGYGFADLVKIGLEKMMDGSYGDWESFMERMGHFEPKKKAGEGSTFNFDNLQIAIMNDRRARGLKD
jgi:hypothetical protein